MRIWRNCANTKDYHQQSEFVVNKLREKSYHDNTLLPIQASVGSMDRQSLLVDKPKRSNRFKDNVTFLTDFSRDYKMMEHIIRKYWPILLRDKTLASFLSKHPTFIYWKAPSLRNRISPNVHNPPKKLRTFLDTTGFYHCKRCKACRTTRIYSRKVNTFRSNSTGKEYQN